MVNRADICRWVGLSGVELEHIIDALEKQDVDWEQVIDWEQEIAEARDFGKRTETVWKKLQRYGISKPMLVSEVGREIKKAEMEEVESLIGSKEGVKTLLRRIYKDPSLSRKQREYLKNQLVGAAPEYATLVALYNGEEMDYAKRFLKEMVLGPTSEIRDLLKGDTLKIRSERGWIKEINDIPLKKAVRSIDFVEHLKDFEVMASQPGDGTIAVYKRKTVIPMVEIPKPVEKPPVAVEIAPVQEIEPLLTQYSYAEIKDIAKRHDIRVSGRKSKMISRLLEANVL